jgi:hypothetical protein
LQRPVSSGAFFHDSVVSETAEIVTVAGIFSHAGGGAPRAAGGLWRDPGECVELAATLGTYVDQYCERLAPGVWAEPLNLASNVAFLVAAGAFAAARRRHGALPSSYCVLAWMVAVVGLGSASFHAFATIGTMIADVAPIGVFLVTYLYVFLRRVVGASVGRAWLGLVLFGIVSGGLGALFKQPWLNGGEMYVGTLVTLVGLAAYLQRARRRGAAWFLAASGAFVASLACRTVDQRVCDAWPIGTHWAWHTLNGVTIWMVLSGLAAADGGAPAREAAAR